MDMLARYPGLIPVQTSDHPATTVYHGYLPVHDREYRLHIGVPVGESVHGATVDGEWRLQCLLEPHRPTLNKMLADSKDLCSFLEKLQSLIESLTENKSSSLGSFAHSQTIIDEMEKIGWEKLVEVDSSFQKLTVQCEDSALRQHTLTVHLNSQECVPPHCVYNLPEKFHFQWNAEGHLSDLVKQFESTLSKYQAFWDAVSVIDQKTWVLDPDTPSFSACSRRIALSPGTSVQIAIDPKHPTALPQCCFLGADKVINPLKEKLNANIHLWDSNSSLVSNLETLLEVALPSPSNSKKEDFSLECGICYSYRLGEEIPDKTCDDARCGQPFHHSCLYEWMRSLSSCQQSFNTIFGECPLCSKPITIKLPTN